MREILFRGKCTSTGEWVYGSLIHVGEFCCILEEDDGTRYDYPYLDCYLGVIDGQVIPVDPETVGQFTGLIDVNGKKIFEGDIDGIPRWVVTYCADVDDGGLGMNAGWYVQRDNFESWTELENTREHHIIGNIHDNPELLEVK
jgi:uncharacterized phage protein (TIGR01671 family)